MARAHQPAVGYRGPRSAHQRRLMAEPRDTLVTVFGRQGYRTVAIMPGLLRGWPEGAFYGFETIYDHTRLDYKGPPFGWWDLNDQFALARADALEIAPRPRRPAFIFFPTITTHAPFTPAPPYQPDWVRVLTTRGLRRGGSRPRLVGSTRLAQSRTGLRPGARLRTRHARRLPPPQGRSRLRDDSDRRSPAAGTRQWRRRILGCAGSRRRQPPRRARPATPSRLSRRADAGWPGGRGDAYTAADVARRLRRRRGQYLGGASMTMRRRRSSS